MSGLDNRPGLTPDLAAREFERWYWLKAELATFARSIGVDLLPLIADRTNPA
jgi:SAP domain-containing new25